MVADGAVIGAICCHATAYNDVELSSVIVINCKSCIGHLYANFSYVRAALIIIIIMGAGNCKHS
jgi:hypothetical protein